MVFENLAALDEFLRSLFSPYINHQNARGALVPEEMFLQTDAPRYARPCRNRATPLCVLLQQSKSENEP
jgi:hypothetical protein